MRLFVAIELFRALRTHLTQLQDAIRILSPNLSFTRPENLHLTLKFLGEVADRDVPALTDALASISPVGEFELTTTGIICFPDRGRIRVISADVQPNATLLELQQRLDAVTELKCFPREQRPFHPHITLARARTPVPAPMRQTLTAAATTDKPAPTMTAHEFVLMESRLHPKGAGYTPSARFYIKLP